MDRARSRRPDRAGSSLFAAVLLLLILPGGCGYLAEKGEESRGTANLPSQGIGPWVKYDQECPEEQVLEPGQAPNLDLQPILLPNPSPFPLPGTPVLAEPWAMLEPSGTVVLFYEERDADRSMIRRAVLRFGPGAFCRPIGVTVVEDEVVFEPDMGPFERGRVGAPTVLEGKTLPGVSGAEATFAMYYAGGEANGIGLAVSPDGRTWTRIGAEGRPVDGHGEPLLSPTGGWDQGTIGSPAILIRPDGRFHLYFDGNRNGERAIGLATSRDGVAWTRLDTQGRTGEDAGPIVTPTFTGPKEQTNWEFLRSDEPASGSVGAPMVLLDRGPLRDIYILYYTGNLRGDLGIQRDAYDTSIGVAFSLDGVRFEKASTEVDYPAVANEVNPVLNEIFPLCISNDDLLCLVFALEPFFDLIHGEGGFCTLPENALHPACARYDPGDGTPGSGSSNATLSLMIMDEAEPSVIRVGDRFLLFFHQQSNVFTFFDGGIALALNNFE